MARPERRDADYFPFYCRDGKTLFILESKYQCKGTGFFTNVMRFLTMQTDHHVCIKEEADRLYFFSKVKCDEESGMDMLNLMAMTGKIDRPLWDKSRVIASPALLDSLKDAYRQRRNPIITIEQIRVNHAVMEVNSTENPVKEELPTGLNHKGKERKGKERKGKTSIPDGFDVSDRVKKWASEKGFTHLNEHLEAFKLSCNAKGYKYVDWDSAFMTAIRDDWAKIRSGGTNGTGTQRRQFGYGKSTGPEIDQSILDTSERLRRKYESPGNASES